MELFEAPTKDLSLIRSHNVQPLDGSKETMVLVFTKLAFSKEQDHLTGWYRQMIKEILEPQFNLVWVGVDNDPSRILHMGYSNIYTIHSSDFEAIKDSKFKRAKEMEDDSSNSDYNRDILLGFFEKELPKIHPEYLMWLDERWAFLPLKDYWSKKQAPEVSEMGAVNLGNEFHDYVGNDPKVKDFILKTCKDVNSRYDYHVGILTFTYWMKNLTYNLGKWFIQKGCEKSKFKKSYYFVIDPGSYYRVFDSISPKHVNFAMARDFRGTRDFEFFPVQEMQHFFYEKPWTVDKTKKRKFCFYGTLFLSKKTRKNLWDTYLKDLRGEQIDIYVPPKMDGHISERRKEGASITRLNDRVQKDADIAELWESVSSHPNYKGYIDTQELNSVLAQYEYALIAKNIARYDSINFRPALYIALDVFPLLDHRYDPEFVGIPQHIQDKIVVRNHKEILEKIAYYDKNPKERNAVMQMLKDHYKYENFRENWIETVKTSLNFG
jgi:hypothetical protein